ncbi:MAG: BrnT family toxin [Desulfobaccales bacterium]
MEFDWDPAKAEENLRVHGVNFAAAVGVFDNPYLSWEDHDSEREQRFRALGMDGLGRILVVVYTYRPSKIRMISARKASKKEGKEYAQRIRFQ